MTQDTGTAPIIMSTSSCFFRMRRDRKTRLQQHSLRPRSCVAAALEVEASPTDENLAGYVIGERRAEEKDSARRLGRRAQPAQWASGFHRFQHFGLHTD